MDKKEFKEFREIVIKLILMTDPSLHFQHFKKLESLIQLKEDFNQRSNLDNFITFTGNMLHCADLHGPAKKPEEAIQWSQLIQGEFLDQLEKEEKNNLPVTKFFQDIKKHKENCLNEIFFHEKIVLPLWDLFNNYFENQLQKEVENIKKNLQRWERDSLLPMK